MQHCETAKEDVWEGEGVGEGAGEDVLSMPIAVTSVTRAYQRLQKKSYK